MRGPELTSNRSFKSVFFLTCHFQYSGSKGSIQFSKRPVAREMVKNGPACPGMVVINTDHRCTVLLSTGMP